MFRNVLQKFCQDHILNFNPVRIRVRVGVSSNPVLSLVNNEALLIPAFEWPFSFVRKLLETGIINIKLSYIFS